MKFRGTWVMLGVAVVVLAGGGLYYARNRAATAPQSQRSRDPALALFASIRALESDPQTQLTKEQIETILPFIKALKDIPLADAVAVDAIVQAVRDTFTPDQRAALETARKRFQERQSSGVQAAPGSGGADSEGAPGGGVRGTGPARAPGGGRALSDDQRQQFRAAAFQRMIRYLERRMKQ
jgi:hypothetical protein